MLPAPDPPFEIIRRLVEATVPEHTNAWGISFIFGGELGETWPFPATSGQLVGVRVYSPPPTDVPPALSHVPPAPAYEAQAHFTHGSVTLSVRALSVMEPVVLLRDALARLPREADDEIQRAFDRAGARYGPSAVAEAHAIIEQRLDSLAAEFGPLRITERRDAGPGADWEVVVSFSRPTVLTWCRVYLEPFRGDVININCIHPPGWSSPPRRQGSRLEPRAQP